jgi:glycine/D-amino acid oxidase-like deaminating enzyme
MVDTVSRIPDCEVAVIGGGILGLATGALVAQRGYSVHTFRLGNRGRPRADTLRNQGWLQSGLTHIGRLGGDRKRGRLLADQMYNAGLTMLEGLGLPVPNGIDCGVVRVRPGTDEARHLRDDAGSLGIGHLVRELDQATAKSRLGPVFDDGNYYSIPDVPFPEGTVLERFRDIATQHGVTFVECQSPVLLEKRDQSPSGHVIVCGGNKLSSRVTIMAAGAGSCELLRGVGVAPRMKLQQTPLLVVDGCHSIEAPIFVDRPRRFSFVRHPPDTVRLPNGALVIGTSVVEKDIPYASFDERRIRKDLIDKFEQSLPPCLREHVTSGRFTAGYEVLPDSVMDDRGDNLDYVEPWVEWIGRDEGQRILLAMPGRATMGMHTAERVLGELEEYIGAPFGGAPSTAMSGRWDGDIPMHFHPFYDFDDRERQDQEECN